MSLLYHFPTLIIYVDPRLIKLRSALCCHFQPSSDMNKAKKEPEDKNDNIFVRLYENTKEKRRRRQKSETDPKHRKTNLSKKIMMDNATFYRMSSTPRL